MRFTSGAYMEWTADPKNRRTCPACGETSDGSDCFGGPDPCLGRIFGVIFACCGHGACLLDAYDGDLIDTCYVIATIDRDDGSVLRGDEARAWLEAHGGRPPALTDGLRGVMNLEELDG